MRVSSPAALVPPFRDAVSRLLARLHDLKLKPRLFETYRSPKRAQEMVDAGKSKARGGKSMHCYGMAADIICAEHFWDCEKRGCKFYDVLGAEAKALGMTWGGDFDDDGITRELREHDLPHCQAVPLSAQDDVRRAGPDELAWLAKQHLSRARPGGG